ncbi:Hint domain-containing protein [Yoonia sp.]|uniref:Hint domain-containing protein n=1 Tax=Yoonia sp. TaxID=2212373 RepID=UPI003A4DD5B5
MNNPDPDPDAPENITGGGFVMQMSNGDLFFRPSAAFINELNGDYPDGFPLISMSFSGAVAAASNGRLFTDAFNPSIQDVHIICFTSGTLIRTASGDKQIEDLVVGDTVTTADHGEQVVRWIKSRTIDTAGLRAFPNLRPVRISAGALGGGLPVQDLLVSPQHRVLVRSKIAVTMFGEIEVLVAAKHLIDMPGIAIADDVTEVTYWHFLCDAHEVVFANDAPAETLYTGAVALMSVGLAAREEIFTLFPELRTAVDRPCGARMMLTGRQGRKLAERHAKNVRTLVAAE